MLPLRDDNPTRRTPVLTIGLIAINFAVFLYQQSRPNNDNPSDSQTALICKFGTIPDVIFHGAGSTPRLDGQVTCEYLNHHQSPWLALVTSQFLHAGWLHILGNMLFLWIFGNNVEDRLGRLRFVPFYLLGGIVAALAQGLSDPQSPAPQIGASGAIAAVLGAYLVLYPRARVWTLVGWIPLKIPAWVVIVGFLVLQFLYLGQQSAVGGGGGGGVAYWAHIGGLLFGVLAIRPFLTGRPPPAPARPTDATPWA